MESSDFTRFTGAFLDLIIEVNCFSKRMSTMSQRTTRRWTWALGVSLAFGSSISASAQPPTAQRVVQQKKAANQALAKSQARIDAVSQESETLVQEYRALSESLIALRAQNAQLEKAVSEQRQELVSLDEQVGRVAKVRLELAPLLTRMVQALDEFVALDLPFLSKERAARSRELHALIDGGQSKVTTQARRIFEAYLVELGYGQTLEAYEDQIQLGGQTTAVMLLRVGRVGLYYLSLDEAQAGRYNPVTRRFEAVDAELVPGIKTAIRVAQKRAVPQLITVPVAQTPVKEGLRS